MKKYVIVTAVLALFVAACGGDGSSATDGSNPGQVEETRPVTITGTPLPLFPDGGADPAVGMAMPEVEGASFDGSPVTIVNDGRPKVLLILAHW